MPANRSRTEKYRDSLHQILSRGGGIDLSVDVPADHGADVVWRVRLLAFNDDEIIAEAPAAAGSAIPMPPGTLLVGAMSIGQNRWMFHTRVLGPGPIGGAGRGIATLRLSAPEGIERCARRNFFRISTASVSLPNVICWPLLDAGSVGPAEAANAAMAHDLARSGEVWGGTKPDGLLLPEVGPQFTGKLANLGGGGLGLILDRAEAAGVDKTRLFWMWVDLRPATPSPIGVTARLVHTHTDSQQNTYAGMAFEFQFNPVHRAFVVEQITQYVDAQRQRQQKAA